MNKRLSPIPVIVTILLAASLALVTCLLIIRTEPKIFSTTFAQKEMIEENGTTVKDKDVKMPEAQQENTVNPSRSTPSNAVSTPAPQQAVKEQKPKRLVVIDPGHGGNDPGTKGHGVVEKEVTLDIALKLNEILKKLNIYTYMIRTEDIYIDHKDRIIKANEMKAALYLSIHCDWFGDSSLQGTQTLYYPSKTLSMGNLVEIDYANIIQNELIKALKTNNRGIDDRPNLAVLRRAEMPSVLVELGFLSNKADAERLSSEGFKQAAAQALAEGVKKSLEKID